MKKLRFWIKCIQIFWQDRTSKPLCNLEKGEINLNKFEVKLKDNNKAIIVKAETFINNIFGNIITFVDKENKPIALFDKSQVQYINLIQNKYAK